MSCECVEYIDKKNEEYVRLSKLPRVDIKKNDYVVVAVGLIGHGYDHVRKECRVLKVRKNSAKIHFPDSGYITRPQGWTYWIDRALITDMVRHGEACCKCHCYCC